MLKWLKKSSYPAVSALEESLNSTAERVVNPVGGKEKRRFPAKFVRALARKLRGKDKGGKRCESWYKLPDDSAVVLSLGDEDEGEEVTAPGAPAPPKSKPETVEDGALCEALSGGNEMSVVPWDDSVSKCGKINEMERGGTQRRRLSHPKSLKRILSTRRNSSSLKDSRDSGWEGMSSSSSSSVSSLIGRETEFSASSPVRQSTAVKDNWDGKRPMTLSRQTTGATGASLPGHTVKMMFDSFAEFPRETGLANSNGEVSTCFENISGTCSDEGTRRVASWPNSHMSANNASESVSDFFEEMRNIKMLQAAGRYNDKFFSTIYSESRPSSAIDCYSDNDPLRFNSNGDRGKVCAAKRLEVGEDVEYQDVCIDFGEEEEEEEEEEDGEKIVRTRNSSKGVQRGVRLRESQSRYVITMYV